MDLHEQTPRDATTDVCAKTDNPTRTRQSHSPYNQKRRRTFPQYSYRDEHTRGARAWTRQGAGNEEHVRNDLGDVRMTQEAVTDFIQSHRTYTAPGLTESIHDQPKFDDICQYGLAPSQETQLWDLEARRLIAAVDAGDSSTTLRFSFKKDLPTSRENFERLSSVADQALHHIAICTHDNQLVLFKHRRDAFDTNVFLAARRTITQRHNRRSAVRMSQKHAAESSTVHEDDQRFYCSLIDYITAVAARFACHAVTDEFWRIRSLAALAKCAAKMKFLGISPENIADQSLETGWDIFATDEARDIIATSQQLDSPHHATNLDSKISISRNNMSQVRATDNLYRTDEVDGGMYFSEMTTTSQWAFDNMMFIFTDLKGSKLSGSSVDTFDMCSLVYGTAWHDIPTLVSQDRHGEIAGTSARSSLRILYEALRIIVQVADTIQEEQNRTRTRDGPKEGGGVRLWLDLRDEHGTRQTRVNDYAPHTDLYLNTFADVLSVMIPLLHTQPDPLLHLNRASGFVRAISSISGSIESKSPPVTKFSGFASLRTQAYRDRKSHGEPNADFGTLSSFLGVREDLFKVVNPQGSFLWMSFSWMSMINRMIFLALCAVFIPFGIKDNPYGVEKQWMLESTVRSWVIEEKAIVVLRRAYVAMVMTACGVLVVGGILAGLLLGERLAGVDPFNITTFAWVLAGFIILLAKSLSVREWPWRDFLHGRVPCRSISELHNVTGIDEQEIMQYLLAKEAYSILITKGPFNRLFTRRSEDGFSIDVKMKLSTLVASGIIVVKVASHMGPALVCLDIRRGADGRTSVGHSDGPGENEQLVGCFEFPEAFGESEDVQLHTMSESMTWTRVLGIYDPIYKQFR